MSVDSYSKHQRSSKAKYIVTDLSGKVLIRANSEKDYLEKRKQLLIGDKSENE